MACPITCISNTAIAPVSLNSCTIDNDSDDELESLKELVGKVETTGCRICGIDPKYATIATCHVCRIDPKYATFDTVKMRLHLASCLHAEKIDLFPYFYLK